MNLCASTRALALEPGDAALFAANAVCLGRDIVLSECSDELKSRLTDRGYRVHTTPLGAFARSGGSAFCLTLRLDNRSDAIGRSTIAERARLWP